MRHYRRHLFVGLVFLLLLAYGLLFAGKNSPLRADVAHDDEAFEWTVESWSDDLRRQHLQWDKATRKAYALHAHSAIPVLADVIDDRTLLTPEYYAAQNLLMVAGPLRRAAQERMHLALQRDRYVRHAHEIATGLLEEMSTTQNPSLNTTREMPKELKFKASRRFTARERQSLDTAQSPHNGTLFAGDELDFAVKQMLCCANEAECALPDPRATCPKGEAQEDKVDSLRGDAYEMLLPLSMQSSTLETASARRVPPLPPGVQRTNHTTGEITVVDKRHFYAVNPTKLRQLEKKEYKKPYVFYNLPRYRAASAPRYAWKKFYITINLHKNVETIPFLTGALIAFLEDEVAPFFDLATSVVVTIYANASPDLTGPLIRSFMIPYLQKAGVENIYATVKGSCGGYIRRFDTLQERIEWMACVRNKAIEPLQELGYHAFSPREAMDLDNPEEGKSYVAQQFTEVQQERPSVEPSPYANGELHLKDDDDDDDDVVVIFLNDIFFRPQDLTRLLESVPEPVMASQTMPDGAHVSDSPDAEEPNASDTWNETTTTTRGTSFDMACGMDYYYFFYDTWVTRDRNGNPMFPAMPYTDDPETREAFVRILEGTQDSFSTPNVPLSEDDNNRNTEHTQHRGADKRSSSASPRSPSYAVPVKCCWNGVAALRGSFLLPPPAARSRVPSQVHSTEPLGEQRYPEALVRPSGAVYLRVDNVPSTQPGTSPASVTTLADAGQQLRRSLSLQYLQVLALRLQAARHAWREGQAKLARRVRDPVPWVTDPSLGNGHNESAATVFIDALEALVDAAMRRDNTLAADDEEEGKGETLTATGDLERKLMSVFHEIDAFSTIPLDVSHFVEQLLKHAQSSTTESGTDPESFFRADGAPRRAESGDAEQDRDALLRLRRFQNQLGSNETPVSILGVTLQEWLQRLESSQVSSRPLLLQQTCPRFSSQQRGLVRNDGVLYRALHPVVRFRHSFTPSYGSFMAASGEAPHAATARQMSPSQQGPPMTPASPYDAVLTALFLQASSPLELAKESTFLSPALPAVKPNVCQASECLLICQDVMHAALTRRGRVPVILMNPLVRVAYEAEHFFRVAAPLPPSFSSDHVPLPTTAADDGALHVDPRLAMSVWSWVYSSPRFFRLCAFVRDVRQAWSRLSARLTLQSSQQEPLEHTKKDAATAFFKRTDTVTSASDDWTRGHPEFTMYVRHTMPSKHSNAEVTLSINVTQHTRMECFLPDADDAMAIVEPLLELLYAAVIVMLLAYLVRSANQQVARKLSQSRRWPVSAASKDAALMAELLREGTPTGSPRGSPAGTVLMPEERLWWRMQSTVGRWLGRNVPAVLRAHTASARRREESLPGRRRRAAVASGWYVLCERVHMTAQQLWQRWKGRRPRTSTTTRGSLRSPQSPATVGAGERLFPATTVAVPVGFPDRGPYNGDGAAMVDSDDGGGYSVSVSSRSQTRSPVAATSWQGNNRQTQFPAAVHERLRFRDPSASANTGAKLV